MSYLYTKEQLFNEFKDVTKKDQSKKKETYTHRIAYLTALKEDMIQVPKNFNNISISPDQLQNLIDDWSAPNPRDATYMGGFGMTYAEKKQQEEPPKQEKETTTITDELSTTRHLWYA